MNDDGKVYCCNIGCVQEAKFRLIDAHEKRPGLGETHSCEDHLGELVGHDEGFDLPEGEQEEWHVLLI